LRLSGEVIEEKIPVTRQSIDLPANETGTVEGAMEAGRAREELRINMRKERRSSIKEKNFLKSM
jgi:large subunit ribosomal protein L54